MLLVPRFSAKGCLGGAVARQRRISHDCDTQTNQRLQCDHDSACHRTSSDRHRSPCYRQSSASLCSREAGTYTIHDKEAPLLVLQPEHFSRALHALVGSQGALSTASYICLLRACIHSKSAFHAKQIYTHLIRQKMIIDGFLGDYLVVTLAVCGCIDDALSFLRLLKRGTVYSWTAIISACVKCGWGHNAFKIFNLMLEDGVLPNHATFVSLFQASSITRDVQQGKKLHMDARKKGFLSNQLVGNSLLSMYAKCGAIEQAEDVFIELPCRDVVSWNTLLAAYIDQGRAAKALQVYRQMQEEGQQPDHLTLTGTVQACSSLAEAQKEDDCAIQMMPLEIGLALHARARKFSLTGQVVTGTALVILYGKCQLVWLAEEVFWSLPDSDTVVWNSMLSVYLEQGYHEKALQLYDAMQKEGVTLDEVACMYGLQVSGELGCLEVCTRIHFAMVFAECDQVLSMAATLIQAYRSCASMSNVRSFFEGLYSPDSVTWTTCMAGHAGDGNVLTSLHMFDHLQLAGVEVDEFMFTAVLSACSHVGLVPEGLEYFNSLRSHHGKVPHLKHYGTMLDLLGRAGSFKELNTIMKQMPMQADLSIWLCLLGACRMHGQVEFARHAFNHVVGLHPDHTLAYILMANIYIDAGMRDLAADVDIVRHRQAGISRLMDELIDDELCMHL